MRNWLLPENIADILPASARQLETAKASMLELFRTHGYELVCPPLIEYVESLVSDGDMALDLKTFKLDDQLSGRQLGLRADITPQVARIDAHLLGSREGVTRLCYAGSVVHSRPDSLTASREPLQIGAELYGCADTGADLEIIHLMLATLRTVGIDQLTLDLGHLGVFYALVNAAGLEKKHIANLLQLLQAKDVASLREELTCVADPYRSALLRLPELFGPDCLRLARQHLPALPALEQALAQLEQIGQSLEQEQVQVYYDLTELRGTHYHTGLIFAVYAEGWASELARGGRYDNVGRKFGRARPATGFSLDLRDLLRILPKTSPQQGIRLAAADHAAATSSATRLRAEGEIVVIDYLNESAAALNCDRQLVFRDGDWQVVPFH